MDITKGDTADLFGWLLTNISCVRAHLMSRCCTGMTAVTTGLANCCTTVLWLANLKALSTFFYILRICIYNLDVSPKYVAVFFFNICHWIQNSYLTSASKHLSTPHSEWDKLHYLFFGFFFNQISGRVTIHPRTQHHMPKYLNPQQHCCVLFLCHYTNKQTNKQTCKQTCMCMLTRLHAHTHKLTYIKVKLYLYLKTTRSTYIWRGE